MCTIRTSPAQSSLSVAVLHVLILFTVVVTHSSLIWQQFVISVAFFASCVVFRREEIVVSLYNAVTSINNLCPIVFTLTGWLYNCVFHHTHCSILITCTD